MRLHACPVILRWVTYVLIFQSAALAQPVRIGVPPTDYSPWFNFTGGTSNNDQLFLPLFVKDLAHETGLEFIFVLWQRNFTPSSFHFNLYGGLVDDDYDVSWLTLLKGLDPYNAYKTVPGVQKGMLAMTCPFHSASYWALIRKQQEPPHFWRFLAPFHWHVWLAIVICLLLVSVAIVFIHVLAPPEGKWGSVSLNGVAGAIYHPWSAFFGGDDFEWITPPARMLRIALLFLVLVSVSTYTANLAAFFVKPSFRLIGPQSLEEMTRETVCMTYSISSEDAKAFAKHVIFPADDVPTNLGSRFEWCHEKLMSGEAGAILEPESTAASLLLKHCATLARAQDISLMPSTQVFLVRSDREGLIEALTTGILSLMARPAYQSLLSNAFSVGQSCDDDDGADGDTTKITFGHMTGFFVIFVSLVGTAVLAAVVQAVLKRTFHPKKHDDDIRDGFSQGEMIVQLSDKVDQILQRLPVSGQSTLPSLVQDGTAGYGKSYFV